MNKKRKIGLLICMLTWITLPLTSIIIKPNSSKKIPYNQIPYNPKLSFYGTASPIFIDDLAENNWSWAEAQPWCTESGGTYYIENLTINGQQTNHCIEIRNSIVSLVVRNCTLVNSSGTGSSPDIFNYGIRLDNVSNTLIQDNHLTGHSTAMCVKKSKDIAILENTLELCANGIFFGNCTYINVSENEISHTSNAAIWLWDCENMIISENSIHDNLWAMPIIDFCINNVIVGNNFSDNRDAVYLDNDPVNNMFYLNRFTNNVNIDAMDWTIEGATAWDNGSVGNYWDRYPGNDQDGDGIGDIPYDLPYSDNVDRFPIGKFEYPRGTLPVISFGNYFWIFTVIGVASLVVFVRKRINWSN
ncbi:MAG: nitrous oxide reductase family maturation protein NosD [Promethearchaeota archaeon]